MAHRVLMIAFHFPPAAMGSGQLRTLGFARYLPEFGWNPIVLSASAMAYPRAEPLGIDAIPPGCDVHRAFALDVGRHFAIAGKYPGFIAQPDRWASWWPAAVALGLRLIRRRKIDAVWSTYPIMTAHCIAHTLARHSGLPWISDFRDPVSVSVSRGSHFTVTSQTRWERHVLSEAAHNVFTTQGAMRDCEDRFPAAGEAGKLTVIPNGYDEPDFVGLPAPSSRGQDRPVRMVHSGLLYSDGRSPLPFFNALADLKSSGALNDGDVEIVLRASGSESRYAADLQRLGLDRMVTLAPVISHRDALHEQAQADGLLLFQGRKFDRQIPAKVYEYLRIGLPIFALVSASGNTAALLREARAGTLVELDDATAIRRQFAQFIDALRGGRAPVMDRKKVAGYSRFRGAATLATLLDAAIGNRSGKTNVGRD